MAWYAGPRSVSSDAAGAAVRTSRPTPCQRHPIPREAGGSSGKVILEVAVLPRNTATGAVPISTRT
jgi:hypothetical protein